MYAAWLLLLAGRAHALDLDDFDVAFTYIVDGKGGNDGVDSALDVALDADGNTVAGGFLDGAAGHDKDAKVLALRIDGSIAWELDAIDSGVDDGTAGSNDRVEAVSINADTGAYVWCGTQGGAGELTQARTWFWIAGSEPDPKGLDNPPVGLYDYVYRAGGSDSLENACFGLAQSDVKGAGRVWTAGWGEGNGDTFGQWVGRQYTALGQFSDQVLVDIGSNADYPDQAYAVTVREGVGDYLLAGTQQATLDTPAWGVRFYLEGSDTPLWAHGRSAANGADARANAAVYDPGRREIFVGGTVNDGTPEKPDRDWLIVSYEDAGNGKGGPDINWEQSYGAGNGFDDTLTGIALDENADVIAAGTRRNGAGRALWRVAIYNNTNGVERSEWISPNFGADSRLEGMAFRDGRIALAGSIDDGTGSGPAFAVIVLENDEDDDGVTDSNDLCPEDPEKIEEGVCGCGQPDLDSDKDGTLNCNDGCPGDPNKLEPGLCGCGQADIDSDNDGTLNCDDNCPADPDKVDVGECGCGTPDDDLDGDGVLRCRDACPDTEEGVSVNEFGCESEGDTGEPPTDGGGGGCGCNTHPPGSAWMIVGLALLGWRSRRRADRGDVARGA